MHSVFDPHLKTRLFMWRKKRSCYILPSLSSLCINDNCFVAVWGESEGGRHPLSHFHLRVKSTKFLQVACIPTGPSESNESGWIILVHIFLPKIFRNYLLRVELWGRPSGTYFQDEPKITVCQVRTIIPLGTNRPQFHCGSGFCLINEENIIIVHDMFVLL